MIHTKSLIIGLLASFCVTVVMAQSDSTSTTKPKLRLSGSISADAGYFESSRNPSRMPNRTFAISGNPRLRFGEWDIPIDFQLGNYANSLLQPFNKLGASPSYKWIKLHLGYRQLSFSPLTYQNHLILGGGIELTPGKFRFTALYGELKRSTNGGLFDDDTRYAPPSFKRMGVLTKIGVGSEERFVDFIFVKGWDEKSEATLLTDSLRITPAENIVLGIHIDQTIAEKLNLKVSGALSAYTQDTRSSLTNTDPYFGSNLVDDIFQQRISSQYLTGLMTSAEYRTSLWHVNAAYDIIQPGFQSMGMYFNQSDIQKVALGGSAKLLDKRLRLSLNWRHENNNLFETRSSENRRRYWNGQADWTQNQSWTASINGSYFSSEQSATSDTVGTLFDFEQATMQGIARFSKRRANGKTHYSLQLTAMQRNDRIANQTAYANISFRGTYTIPLWGGNKWNVHPELGLSRFVILESIQTWRISPGARLNYRSQNKKLDGNLSASPNLQLNETTDNQFIWRTALNFGYRLKKKHRLTFRMDHSLSDGGYSYNEFRVRVGYRYRF